MGMCTAHGVTHALRSCIMESRKDSGYDIKEWVHIGKDLVKKLNKTLEKYSYLPIT